MTEDETKAIDNLAHELCYERLKFSPLWNSPKIKSNDQIDAKAEDFKAMLLLLLEELVEAEVIAVEREAEAAVA